MNSLLTSMGVVALAEMGDKTQLLAFLLAARFRKPAPIIAGILGATLLNHGLAGAVGAWVTQLLPPAALRWIVGLLFLGMAAWTMVPDRIDENDVHVGTRSGVFGATFVAFFLAEMGDKTQIATIAMAAQFDSAFLVVAGTTLGMLIADVPAVFLGEHFSQRIPLRLVRVIAALLFAVLGAATLMGAGKSFGI